MKIELNNRRLGKLYFLLLAFFALAILLISCSAAGPANAQKFLEAINNGDRQAANQYVCKDKQDTLIDDLSKKASIFKKDEDILGLKSPGIKNINCQGKGSIISCTYTAPKLLCSGLDLNDLLKNKPITCTSIDPIGQKMEISLETTGGKFCGYTVVGSK